MASGNGTSNNVQAPLGGERLIDGDIVAALMGGGGVDYAGALTATPGGDQDDSVALSPISQVDVVATNGDGALLPVASAGRWCMVANADAGQSMKVFAQGSDTINGVAGATGVDMALGENAVFFCAEAGKWRGGVLTAF